MLAPHIQEVRSGERVPFEAVSEDDWPTTQRFSRRMGEAFRGAGYAAAVEAPRRDLAQTVAWVVILGALLSAVVMVLWEMA